jgi:hypothetical protein
MRQAHQLNTRINPKPVSENADQTSTVISAIRILTKYIVDCAKERATLDRY